jgi:5-formyltetrahydrofolate cyclo-ligase
VNTQKEVLRKQLKLTRSKMSQEDVDTKSLIIAQKLIDSINWPGIEIASIYSSVKEWKEVDTIQLIEVVEKQYPHVKILTPNTKKAPKFPEEKFNLIIVPALGFDKNKHRIGWGGGWYDKFLSTQSGALKIGLCFQNGFVKDGFAHEPHDIPLDMIFTEV